MGYGRSKIYAPCAATASALCFRAPYLIPFLDVTDNVALLPMLAGKSNKEARRRALELLEALDVAHRAKSNPALLWVVNNSACRLRGHWQIIRR